MKQKKSYLRNVSLFVCLNGSSLFINQRKKHARTCGCVSTCKAIFLFFLGAIFSFSLIKSICLILGTTFLCVIFLPQYARKILFLVVCSSYLYSCCGYFSAHIPAHRPNRKSVLNRDPEATLRAAESHSWAHDPGRSTGESPNPEPNPEEWSAPQMLYWQPS